MSLSLEQLELIKLIDNKVKAVILNGGSEEDILISLLDKMPKMHKSRLNLTDTIIYPI